MNVLLLHKLGMFTANLLLLAQRNQNIHPLWMCLHFSQIEIVRRRRRLGTRWSKSLVATGTLCEITNTIIKWNSSTGRATERGYMPDTPLTRKACFSTFFRIRTTTTCHSQLTCARLWNHCFYCIHTYIHQQNQIKAAYCLVNKE